MRWQTRPFSVRLAGPHAAGRQGRGRFTLIELLVVVSIIAILAAMLLPALSRARGMALSAACQSNLKQLGLTAQLYNDEYNSLPWSSNGEDETRCLGGTGTFHYDGAHTWAYFYSLVSPDIRLYQCPTQGTDARAYKGAGVYETTHYQPRFVTNPIGLRYEHYYQNPYVGSIWDSWTLKGPDSNRMPPVRLERATNPDRVILLIDKYQLELGTAPQSVKTYTATPGAAATVFLGGDRQNADNYSTPAMRPNFGFWHDQRANLVFFDGHGEAQTHERVLGDVNDDQWYVPRCNCNLRCDGTSGGCSGCY